MTGYAFWVSLISLWMDPCAEHHVEDREPTEIPAISGSFSGFPE